MKRIIALVVLAVCVAATSATHADPAYRSGRYCLQSDSADRWKPSRHRINIRLHESLLDLCGGHPA